MKKILTVVGTRPNFIKVTQFNKHLNLPDKGMIHKIVHTGQHYDEKMSTVFFDQFQLTPDFWLNIASGTPNTQMAKIMIGLEGIIEEYKPDIMLVVGDVNSTFAAALTANKLGIKIGHIESGLRSFDRTMPEEINRLLTDEICDYFFVTEKSGYEHLIKEGKKKENIFFVGNTMIDTLVAFEDQIQANTVLEEFELKAKEFVLMTMHRPATVDSEEGLKKLIAVIDMITKTHKLVFPIHPRTLHHLKRLGLADKLEQNSRLILVPPMDYFAFQKLVFASKYVITDSGGIQEETTFRQIPCITLRPNTERPSTVEVGTNILAPFELATIQNLINSIHNGTFKKGIIPDLWDGKATDRIAAVIENL